MCICYQETSCRIFQRQFLFRAISIRVRGEMHDLIKKKKKKPDFRTAPYSEKEITNDVNREATKH